MIMVEKPLFQMKLDRHSFMHYLGSLVLLLFLMLVFNLWDVPETAVFCLTMAFGIVWEIAQHTAYGSRESFDILDVIFNVIGSASGLFIWGAFFGR